MTPAPDNPQSGLTLKLNPDLKNRWTTVLRSGSILQGRGRLRSGESMCCLGVLCHVVNPNNWTKDPFDETTLNYGVCFPQIGDVDDNTLAVLEQTVNPDTTVQEMLSSHNDEEYNHWDFTKIADWIEENL